MHLNFRPWSLTLCALLLPALDAAMTSVDEVRSTTATWLEAEKALSAERLEWEAEKTLLTDLIALARQRENDFNARLAEMDAAATSADDEHRALEATGAHLKERMHRLETFLTDLHPLLRGLRARLPLPLQEDLNPLFADLAATDRTPDQQVQTVMDILRQIRAFDGRISVTESVEASRETSTEVIVQTLWLGLGQAYYLGPNDAGVGYPDADGWHWESRPELANTIRGALRLASGRAQSPEWVDLPLTLPSKEAQ